MSLVTDIVKFQLSAESFYAIELYHSTSLAVNIIFRFQSGNNFKCRLSRWRTVRESKNPPLCCLIPFEIEQALPSAI